MQLTLNNNKKKIDPIVCLYAYNHKLLALISQKVTIAKKQQQKKKIFSFFHYFFLFCFLLIQEPK